MPASLESASSPNFASASRLRRPGISEVWARFLLAILGLGLAFAAAIFSTVSREAGHVWATLILASLALLLAAAVGLGTVPYLARRVATARLREALDYEVTRAGVIYVLAIVVIAVAALNTGNNLLYIIVAAMLAAILVSGLASAFSLRGLQLDVQLPEHIFAGQTLRGRIALRNARRWGPSFSISVVPILRDSSGKRWEWTPATFAFPPGRAPGKHWLMLPDRRLHRVQQAPAPPGIFRGAAYFPYLPSRCQLGTEMALKFDQRGRYQQEGFGLATRFPFAFLTKTRRVALRREVLVYPSVEQTHEFREILPLITGEVENFMRGRGFDLYRIREYMPEDSARHIDWKATAKSGSPKVREFSREDERKLRIVFDNPRPGEISPEAYERAIVLAASLAWHFAGKNTPLSFLAPSFAFAGDGNRGQGIYDFLSYLATIEPGTSPAVLETVPVTNDYNLILTNRERESIPASLLSCSHVFFLSEESSGSSPALSP